MQALFLPVDGKLLKWELLLCYHPSQTHDDANLLYELMSTQKTQQE